MIVIAESNQNVAFFFRIFLSYAILRTPSELPGDKIGKKIMLAQQLNIKFPHKYAILLGNFAFSS